MNNIYYLQEFFSQKYSHKKPKNRTELIHMMSKDIGLDYTTIYYLLTRKTTTFTQRILVALNNHFPDLDYNQIFRY